jgi:hypothetical protein
VCDDFHYVFELTASARPGVVECDGLTVLRRRGGPPIGASKLRKVSVDRLLQSVAMAVAFRIEDGPEGRYYEPAHSVGVRVVVPKPPEPRGRASLTDEHLRKVADVYLAVPRDVRNVRQIVARDPQWGREVPAQTAARWIRAATDRGFLDPSARGQSGQDEEAMPGEGFVEDEGE